ncbi:MAG: glycosyltransferase [Prevotella sp.]|nr:glycosyltransferase [Prevotella sp.]MCM1075129.1 glycosyltransferase [Ruminococcus sp.]
MRVLIINKSDSRGGAAVVSRRLMHALLAQDVQADMLVVEKLTADPNVHIAAPMAKIRIPFIKERLQIFTRNGFNRADLFKADTASFGLPIADNPLVLAADIVLLGWVNQGMLSLKEIGKISSRKPVVWAMHDMWCATGICHHAGNCTGFTARCGKCPLLHSMKGPKDLSFKTHLRKQSLYDNAEITFIAVSNWLKSKCLESSLLADQRVRIIHNPISIPPFKYTAPQPRPRIHMLMTAARIDDPIKGLDTLLQALIHIGKTRPNKLTEFSICFLGSLKDSSYKEKFAQIPNLQVEWHPAVPITQVEHFYRKTDLLLSPSAYETLPGTLVEAHMYGAFPIAFDSGGQRDIISNPSLGLLVKPNGGHKAFAEAIIKASELIKNTDRAALAKKMYNSVKQKFSAEEIARQYIKLFENLIK